jgi:hypothetical protein
MGQPDVLAYPPMALLGAAHPIDDAHKPGAEQPGADGSQGETAVAFPGLAVRRAVRPVHQLCGSHLVRLGTRTAGYR